MKTYTITMKNPRVQKWFNFLYDNAELSNTIEQLSIEHLRLADRVLATIEQLKEKK